eukprot:m.1310466 g.1310466  ORF g.1310466 m.1310466 type:complete len:233 (+) comp24825_c0_seq14:245-943(+)
MIVVLMPVLSDKLHSHGVCISQVKGHNARLVTFIVAVTSGSVRFYASETAVKPGPFFYDQAVNVAAFLPQTIYVVFDGDINTIFLAVQGVSATSVVTVVVTCSNDTLHPTTAPTSAAPTDTPTTASPTRSPTETPTDAQTSHPTITLSIPTPAPATVTPTQAPLHAPSDTSRDTPTAAPTTAPTSRIRTSGPSTGPTDPGTIVLQNGAPDGSSNMVLCSADRTIVAKRVAGS